jgi:hypothetical protein
VRIGAGGIAAGFCEADDGAVSFDPAAALVAKSPSPIRLVHAGMEKKSGKARPFFPSGLPIPRRPRACGSMRRVTTADTNA